MAVREIALDLIAAASGSSPAVYDPLATRKQMADLNGLSEFVSEVHLPPADEKISSDMQVVAETWDRAISRRG